MSTEYRRGIPSTAHVEAATRLGFLWEDATIRMRFIGACLLEAQVLPNASFRPIRPDSTPVDWEVLDQEVARVGQQGQPATVTPTASATQPQGFRADLWQSLCEFILSTRMNSLSDIADVNSEGIVGESVFLSDRHLFYWQAMGLHPDSSGVQTLIARWTVYQELKSLYDLIDGAQGEAAMPRDVAEGLQASYFRDTSFVVNGRDNSGRVCLHIRDENNHTYSPSTLGFNGTTLNDRLANFAAVLDAVAERRVSERMRGQTQAPTVTSTQSEQHRHDWIYDGRGGHNGGQYIHNCACGARDWFVEPMSAPSPRSAVIRPATAQPEPRRFADVRPDRYGWRWWRLFGSDCGALGTPIEANPVHGWRVKDDPDADWHLLGHYNSAVDGIRTVIPTDEQGNPVSWEAAGHIAPAGTVQSVNSDGTVTVPYQETLDRMTRQVLASAVIGVDTTKSPPITTLPLPLPRFTADELDDVDHSKTTKLDEVTLRRGKLPTVEQIAKYREVRARRTCGAVADALKESRIDCEVAQYVLERWAGGLGDSAAFGLVVAALGGHTFTHSGVDARIQFALTQSNDTLDTSEKPSLTVQRERQEAEERRQRLAELRQRLAAERAAQPTPTVPTTASRFDLIEPDPQADPMASIRAWEARQAAAKVRPAAAPPRIAKPAAAPRRPAIEVVDAEADGLSRVEVVTALFGRAFNGGC